MCVENVFRYVRVKFEPNILKYVTYTKNNKLYCSQYKKYTYTIYNITKFSFVLFCVGLKWSYFLLKICRGKYEGDIYACSLFQFSETFKSYFSKKLEAGALVPRFCTLFYLSFKHVM
jgi:hypothetical protein